jgi:hypothetical protein
MRYRSVAALGLAACLVLAGCGDDEESRTPAEPQFNHTASASCDFNFNSLISQFFVQPRQGVVLSLKQQMEAAHQASSETDVQKYGFDILANVEAAVNSGESTNATAGSDLANRLLACMFTEAQLSPVVLPVDFTQELTVAPTGKGAFAVRGGTTQYDSEGPAFSHDQWSGVTPANSAKWSAVLTTRTLLYGERGTDQVSFDWHKILPSTTFSFPYVLVGICVPAGTDQMLVEDGSTVLAFDGTHFGLSCQASAMRRSSTGWGPFDLARRLVRFVTPTSLHAAAMFSNTVTGKSGSFSHFSSDAISGAKSVYQVEPPPTVQVNVAVTNNGQPITVEVTADTPAKPAANVLVTLRVSPTISNQGAKVEVSGETAMTNQSGVATFPNFMIKKAGTYTIEAFFELGRTISGVTYASVAGIQAGGTGKKK